MAVTVTSTPRRSFFGAAGEVFLTLCTIILLGLNYIMPYLLMKDRVTLLPYAVVAISSSILPLLALRSYPKDKRLRLIHFVNLQSSAMAIIGGGIVICWSMLQLPWMQWTPVVVLFGVYFARAVRPIWKLYKTSSEKASLSIRLTALLGAGGDNMIDAVIFMLLIASWISPLSFVWLIVVSMAIKKVWNRFGVGGGNNKFFNYLCSMLNQAAASMIAVWVVLIVTRFL